MSQPTDDLRTNHAWWQERALLHPTSDMYTPLLAKLRRGEPALFDLERTLVGDVSGKRLLHVPCHIGHDTLSWALLGARVTGVDFSEHALAQAAALTRELGLQAEWVQADACRLPDNLDGRFDVAVSTYGAFGWMYDLQGWIDGIARALRPGGRFVLVDGHPLFMALDPEAAARGELQLRDPVMGGEAVHEDSAGSYAQEDAVTQANKSVGWCHGVGDLCQALVRAGFQLETIQEHDWCVWKGRANMVCEGGVYRMDDRWHRRVPLMVSIAAVKAANEKNSIQETNH